MDTGSAQTAPHANEQQPAPPGPATERAILLVEDDPLIREIFAKVLERAGYRVAVARDGLQALHSLWQHSPDLIVLDLCLPVLPGLEVLQRLAQEECDHRPPVIAITARPEQEVAQRARECGAAACLHKPFRPRTLLELVRRLLGTPT
jgi:chemosensory pili system protein ChpA (sensor histidine kinase/response regulator)